MDLTLRRRGANATNEATSEPRAAARPESVVFAQLYDQYAGGIYTYCRLRLPDPTEAEDVAATVFEKAFAAYPPAPTGSIKGWLFTIAHNEVVSFYRRRSRRGYQQSIDDAHHLADPTPSPEDAALRADEQRRLYYAMEQLPEAQRRAVELRLSGLSGAEIAELLHKSELAVRQLNLRAMQRLREVLGSPNQEATDVR